MTMEKENNINNVSKQKSRKENFNSDELEVLIQGVSSRAKIVNAKFGSLVTNATKESAWSAIAAEVSAASGVLRTSAEIKRKWIKHKSELKQKVSVRYLLIYCKKCRFIVHWSYLILSAFIYKIDFDRLLHATQREEKLAGDQAQRRT